MRAGDQWQVVWSLAEEPKLTPQVIPVNYLRWDVIYAVRKMTGELRM